MNSSHKHIGSGLRAEFPSSLTFPALSAGITSGLSLLVAQVAFGTFIFSGALAPYSSQGIGLVLFGNFAACLLIALAGGFRGAIAGLSPVLVLAMATIAASMQGDGPQLFSTTACALIISAVATGICCLLVGRFRLANLLRFIPFPVAGGFVAGIGGAVCLAAMSLMGADLDGRMGVLLEPTVLWTWFPGLIFGVTLYLAMKRWRNPLILPASVLLGIGAYHFALSGLNISESAAREAGLLLARTTQGNLWPALFPATGLASLVAGLGGGTVATVIVPASLRSKLFRATTRLTGVFAACVIGVALLFGDGMLEWVPTAFVGGMLVFAGLGMLDEGLVKTRRRLPGSEYAIILLIFVVIIFFGLLEGVGIGAVATLVFFAVRLSRVNPVASYFTARERRSNKTRSIPDRAILQAEGDRVHVYRLQGYIFFGSIGVLADRLRKSLDGSSRPSCLMIDFTEVSGFDYSAVSVMARFVQKAQTAGVQLVLSGLSEKLRISLERNIAPSVFADLPLEPNADLGLERCEELIIAGWREDAGKMEQRRDSLLEHTVDDLERYLEHQVHFEDLIEALRPWLISRRYEAGEVLAGSEVPPEGLQLLVSGRASVHDSEGRRLRQCSPGDAIWPANPAAETKTTVVADESCRAMLLMPGTRRTLEEREQGLTIELYRYLLAKQFRTEPDEEAPKGAN